METNARSSIEIPGVKTVTKGKLRWSLTNNDIFGWVATLQYCEGAAEEWLYVSMVVSTYEDMWLCYGKPATLAIERKLGFTLPDSESTFMELIAELK